MNLPNRPHQPQTPPVTEETVHDAPPRRRGRIPGGHAGRGRFDPGIEHAIASADSIRFQVGELGIVWVDHRHARLLLRHSDGSLSSRDFENSEYRLPKATGGRAVTAPAHLGGNPATHRRENRQEWLHRYYDEIIDAIEPLDGFVIAGPGPAKNELHRHLQRRHAAEDRLIGMLAMPARVGDSDLTAALDRLANGP
jgi:hypothetical protein